MQYQPACTIYKKADIFLQAEFYSVDDLGYEKALYTSPWPPSYAHQIASHCIAITVW